MNTRDLVVSLVVTLGWGAAGAYGDLEPIQKPSRFSIGDTTCGAKVIVDTRGAFAVSPDDVLGAVAQAIGAGHAGSPPDKKTVHKDQNASVTATKADGPDASAQVTGTMTTFQPAGQLTVRVKGSAVVTTGPGVASITVYDPMRLTVADGDAYDFGITLDRWDLGLAEGCTLSGVGSLDGHIGLWDEAHTTYTPYVDYLVSLLPDAPLKATVWLSGVENPTQSQQLETAFQYNSAADRWELQSDDVLHVSGAFSGSASYYLDFSVNGAVPEPCTGAIVLLAAALSRRR